jgi:Domain of unknown function (DUF397)
MTSPDRWIKATASNDNGSCVEMRRQENLIEVRDTKDGAVGPILRFTSSEFAAWLDGAKKQEFDHLV